MSIFVFGPILFFGIIFLFLYLVQRYAHQRGLKFVIGGYVIVLLITVVFYYLLPDTNLVESSINKNDDDREEYSGKFYDAANNGTIGELEGVKTLKQWKLTYSENTLDISALHDVPMLTVFERKQSDDDLIEIIHYASNTEYLGIKLSEELHPPIVGLEGNQLYFSFDSYELEITFSSFHKDFVVSQFKGGGVEDILETDILDHPLDNEVIYIRIPHNLDLTGMDYINYVGEEQ